MFSFFKKSQNKNSRMQTAPHSSTNRVAHPSTILPQFPTNPMYDFVPGAPITEQRLANVAAVASCICEAFTTWKHHKIGNEWPEYAEEELAAISVVVRKMHASVPKHICSGPQWNCYRPTIRSILRPHYLPTAIRSGSH